MACEGIVIETSPINEVIEVGVVGPQGPSGAAGVGVPTGGITGYVLAKASTADYDTEWVAQTGGGGNFSSPPPIGDVTPNTGAFTTLTAVTGNFTTVSASGIAYFPHIHGNIAGSLYIHVKNTSGSAISRGTPVYITGNVGGSETVEVATADFDNAAKMPAVGLLGQDLAQNESGHAVIVGELLNVNTAAYSLNSELYVGNNGALTASVPTAVGQIIQTVGIVSRVQSNTGIIVVNMQGERSTMPAAHASSHFTAGSDPLAPSDIGAQSAQVTETISLSSSVTLTASRNKLWKISNATASNYFVELPTTGISVGDIVEIEYTSSTGRTLEIRRDGVAIGQSLPTITRSSYRADTNLANGWTPIALNYSNAGFLFFTQGDVLLGRQGTSGQAQEISCSAAGRAILDDADAAAQRTTLGLGTAATSATGDFAAASHSHGNINSSGQVGSTSGLPLVTTTAGAVTTLALGTAGQVLTVNSGATGVEFAASGGIGGSTGSTDNVILRSDGTGAATLQNSALQLDDATTSTQANVAIVNAHSETNSALVLTPKGTGAFIVGPKPDGAATGGGNARGADAVCIQPSGRSAATQVASGAQSVAIGYRSTASGSNSIAIRGNAGTADGIAIRGTTSGSGTNAIAIGGSSAASNNVSIAIGQNATSSASGAIALGSSSNSSGQNNAIAIGYLSAASAADAAAIGGESTTASGVRAVGLGSFVTANLRSQFATRPFASVYWSGQTTTNAATILNLDGTATNRFTIAANTALIADIFLIARISDNTKFLSARRSVAIYRDNANVTALIGDVQTLGNDQSFGSPTWSIALTADNTNEALQLEVTGATGETVNWRATAFYRVV